MAKRAQDTLRRAFYLAHNWLVRTKKVLLICLLGFMITTDFFVLEKVSAKNVSDFVREQLEEAIILKELLSEEQLPTERELSEIFNASRITVRD